MRPDDVLTWTRAVPFRPFRIVLNSGRSYEIRHPEMVRLTRSTAFIFLSDGEPAEPYERVEMISLLLMERLEPLDGRGERPKGKRR